MAVPVLVPAAVQVAVPVLVPAAVQVAVPVLVPAAVQVAVPVRDTADNHALPSCSCLSQVDEVLNKPIVVCETDGA